MAYGHYLPQAQQAPGLQVRFPWTCYVAALCPAGPDVLRRALHCTCGIYQRVQCVTRLCQAQYGGSLLEHALSSPLQPATSLAGSCCGVLPSLFGGAPADAGPVHAAPSSPLPGAPCGAGMPTQGYQLVEVTFLCTQVPVCEEALKP